MRDPLAELWPQRPETMFDHTRIFPMEKHFFPLIFDYLIRGKEGRGEGRKDRMDFAREEIEERLSRGKKIVSYMRECLRQCSIPFKFFR